MSAKHFIAVVFFTLLASCSKPSHASLIEHVIDVVYDGKTVSIDYFGDSTLETGTVVSMVFNAADGYHWTDMESGPLFPIVPVEGQRDWRYGEQSYRYSLQGETVFEAQGEFASAAYGHIFDTIKSYSGSFDSLTIDFLFTRTKLAGTETSLLSNFDTYWYGDAGLPFDARFVLFEVDSSSAFLLFGAFIFFGLWRKGSGLN